MSSLSKYHARNHHPLRYRRTATHTRPLAMEQLEDRTLLSGTMIELGDLPGDDVFSSADGTNAELPPPELVIDDVSLSEGSNGSTVMEFTVTRQGDASGVSLVDYATTDETATAGQDYTADSGTLIFAGGVIEQTISITIFSDSEVEGTETFSVNLSGAFGAVIVDDQGIGTILNTLVISGTMIGLGDLPGGDFESLAYGMSNDGSVIVGFSESANGREAFRWTAETGMVGLGDLPGGGFSSTASAVSADGSVIVGWSEIVGSTNDSPSVYEAFRWTAETGMVGLGNLPGGGFHSLASAVSANGSVIVGISDSINGYDEAFRWTAETGMVGLGDLPGSDFYSSASTISADGSVIAGKSYSANGTEAFRWTAETGMVGLGDLPGGDFSSQAKEISADGSVIVGFSDSTNGIFEAFRWTAETGMVGLGDLPGGDFYSWASGASADGSVIVGWGDSANGTEAYRWTVETGMVGLGDLSGGSFESYAEGISADGTMIAGVSNSTNGWEAFLWTQDAGEQSQILITDNSDATDDASIQFTTALSQFRTGTADSLLVRPSFPDALHHIDVTNNGTAALTLFELQINAPDVTVDVSLTSSAGDDITLAAGQTQRFTLTYAPSSPNLQDSSGQNFALANGITLLSDDPNTPTINIALAGQSTFNSDISYDGFVNLGELGVLNANFGTSNANPNFDPTADINGDGTINLGDLGLLNAEFGLSLPPAPAAIIETQEEPTAAYFANSEPNSTALLDESTDALAEEVARRTYYQAAPIMEESPIAMLPEQENFFEELGGGEDINMDLFDLEADHIADLSVAV